jgi:hypothetical protein
MTRKKNARPRVSLFLFQLLFVRFQLFSDKISQVVYAGGVGQVECFLGGTEASSPKSTRSLPAFLMAGVALSEP